MAYVLKSVPKVWIWVYGVQLDMSEEPEPGDEHSWYRAKWTNAAVTDETGRLVPGYFDAGFEDMWIRDVQAWMPMPDPPDPENLRDYRMERQLSNPHRRNRTHGHRSRH